MQYGQSIDQKEIIKDWPEYLCSIALRVFISNGINSDANERLEKNKKNKRIFNFI
jgi:hypothetical protein